MSANLTAREVLHAEGSWQNSSVHTQLLGSSLWLPQNLQPQLATQAGLHPFKKRRKTQFSQQGHASSRAAQRTYISTSPLAEPWQAACSQIKTFLAGLAPAASNAVDDAGEHMQLQALLHTCLAARKLHSAGLTVALCTVAGKWVKHVLQQQQLEQSIGPHTCFDLIGKCTSCYAFALQAHRMPCMLSKLGLRPVPDLHRCL